MEKKFAKIASLLEKNPSAAFEDFLLKIKDEQDIDDDVLHLFYQCILTQKDIQYEDAKYEIFNQNLDKVDKRFIAICFLRLIAVNTYIINTKNNEERLIIKLLDENLQDIYSNPKVSLSEKDNSFDKYDKLGTLVSSIESELRMLQQDLNNLSDIKQFRHKYFRLLGDKISKSIFPYFLPNELMNSLQKIFNIIVDYQDLIGRNKIFTYKDISHKLNTLLEEIEKGKNPYWNKMIRSLSLQILKIVEDDFSSSPLSKPAKLTITPFDKKYSLSILDSEFKISLDIKNIGLGSAFDVKLTILEYTNGIVISKNIEEITEINYESINVKFESKVIEPVSDVILEVELSWSNADSTTSIFNDEIIIEGQQTSVDWELIKGEDPYSQEPVENEKELIGREEVINKIYTGISKSKVASYCILGQRRVGKTSIIKTLKSKIEQLYSPKDFQVIYIESGDFKNPNPEKTISTLGIKICKNIKSHNSKFTNIETPNFQEAFSPITDFFDEISIVSPTYKTLIIIDEFDQISSELYTRTERADSFFLTIRSISNRPNIGFVLVGGEQMELLISCQGEKLNKFRSIHVDYFDREKEWSDFQNLVIQPISNMGLTIANGVIDKLYEYTSGNPYYTKMICETLFNDMVEKRDAYITTEELEESIKNSLRVVKKNSFMHFWEDGIKEDSSKKEDISIQRRLILKSFAQAVIKWGKELDIENIVDEASKYSLLNEVNIRERISEFERRQILIIDNKGIRLKVKFFEEWLINTGIKAIATEYADSDKKQQQLFLMNEKIIKSEEVTSLVEQWESKSYLGNVITTDNLRTWLSQFDTPPKQRIAFKLLQNIRFYDDSIIRVKLKEIYNHGPREIVWHIKGQKRQDILVSYLDNSIGKSGAEYAKLFVDANNIYVDNIVLPDKLVSTITKRKEIKGLVFVDDIIGSGESMSKNLENLISDLTLSTILKENQIKIYIGVICGFQKAKENIERKIRKLDIDITIHISDLLDEKDKCFSDEANIFPSQNEKMEAKAVCYEHGVLLEKKHPLGYSDCQTLIVFPRTCPNNSLPILWKKSDTWIPLFERPNASK